MSRRPLVPVLGLAVGDYLLWNWSLNGSHDVLALVSGLTLPPLAVACVWLLVLSVADLIAASIRRPSARTRTGARSATQRCRRRPRRQPASPSATVAGQNAQAATAQTRADSRKLAA